MMRANRLRLKCFFFFRCFLWTLRWGRVPYRAWMWHRCCWQRVHCERVTLIDSLLDLCLNDMTSQILSNSDRFRILMHVCYWWGLIYNIYLKELFDWLIGTFVSLLNFLLLLWSTWSTFLFFCLSYFVSFDHFCIFLLYFWAGFLFTFNSCNVSFLITGTRIEARTQFISFVIHPPKARSH